MSIRLKLEDIFKPAKPDELSNRRSDRAKQIDAQIQTAKCDQCGALIKDNCTEIWAVHQTNTQAWEWVDGKWREAGRVETEDNDDYEESNYECSGCGSTIYFDDMDIPGPRDEPTA